VFRIRDVYPGSRIRLFSIPGPGSELSPSRNRIQEFKYFNPKKMVLSSRKYDPGCSSRIPDPDADFLPIPDPGVKKAPDPDPQHCCARGSWSQELWSLLRERAPPGSTDRGLRGTKEKKKKRSQCYPRGASSLSSSVPDLFHRHAFSGRGWPLRDVKATRVALILRRGYPPLS
jgi:hypothetical protein